MTYISPHIEPVLGYTPEEWVSDGGALFSALLHPDDREWVEAHLGEVPRATGRCSRRSTA